MPTYNFSDTTQSFTGVGGSDVLTFNDDTGVFNSWMFSFFQDGNDLVMYGNNGSGYGSGYYATITNHFSNNTNRIETLSFAFNSGWNIDLTHASLIVTDLSNTYTT